MIAVTIEVIGHPDLPGPQTFIVKSGHTLKLSPKILERARQLSITVEEKDATQETDSGGEASQRLDSPSPVRNS